MLAKLLYDFTLINYFTLVFILPSMVFRAEKHIPNTSHIIGHIQLTPGR